MSAFYLKQRQEASDGWSLNSRLGDLDLGLEGEESVCELLALLEKSVIFPANAIRFEVQGRDTHLVEWIQ